MKLLERFGLVYLIIPHIFVIKNKIGLILSILFGQKYKIKLNDISLEFSPSQFSLMQSLLGILTYATSYSIKPEKKLEFSFDTKNQFTISLENLSEEKLNLEDVNLTYLFFESTRSGANFISKEKWDSRNFRDKTFNLIEKNDRKIIETSKGVRFYIDSIHPGNTIDEAFVRDIHLTSSKIDWHEKTVIDVGAEMGDTPLYYASMGAKVYAFEPMPEHFEAMLQNISLNPKLEKLISPINAAVGKDGKLKFYQNKFGKVGQTSFLINKHGEDFKEIFVEGYSFESVFSKFNINHVDLLKLDCKGCECFLNEKTLDNVDRVKIEFEKVFSSLKLENFLNMLETAGFECLIYRISPYSPRLSNKDSCHIYGIKKKLMKEIEEN